MTVSAAEFHKEVKEILKYGEPVRFKYYNSSFGAGSYYDDDVTLTQSGADGWATGLVQPIDNFGGGVDAVLLQQGMIKENDSKIYVLGSVQTSGLSNIKVGLGSPNFEEYEMLERGNIQWVVNGSPVYKKIYVRYLTNGSFVGE